MRKYLSRAFAGVLFTFALLNITTVSASVTIHDTVNGTTTVSCTGGCTLSGNWWGTEVCDANNVCVTVVGRVQVAPEDTLEGSIGG